MGEQRYAASRLVRLLGEIEHLEQARAALLMRVERTRSGLLAAGDRGSAMRASAELLCDHISDVGAASEELSMLEREMQDVEQSVEKFGKEASGLAFEAESLQETLNEADEELERLSLLLIERKTKQSRGH